ncbi:helix-turn-helix transcriptional regulator [Cellulomonas sp. NS3]|uniref:helix-turn-helix transcriptional regulator n=1 Tax=Cellulomonas sp. NS3 TaxID=2973977 RepID=UPI0021619E44|nr:helix-turn-helix transcriptional regulator [Cellulomonas sp. NS3]
MSSPAPRTQARPGRAGADSAVRQRRRALRITQAELAEASEVSRQTIIAIEQGDYAPSVFLALRIARTLGSTVEDLFGAPEPHPGGSA